ncbi:MAG: hypothetical protein RKP20_00860 [Candidatus Competibacter sp.]|nr:hypothetical protein [Candidatus Competibacter sp.]
MNSEQPLLPNAPTEADPDLERREVLKRLGRYAAYTPPAVLTLLASRKALADSLGGPIDPPPPEP